MMSNNNILDFHKIHLSAAPLFVRFALAHTSVGGVEPRNRRLAYTLQGEGGLRGGGKLYRDDEEQGRGITCGGSS